MSGSIVVKIDEEGIMHGDAEMIIKRIKWCVLGRRSSHCSCIKQSFAMHAESEIFSAEEPGKLHTLISAELHAFIYVSYTLIVFIRKSTLV